MLPKQLVGDEIRDDYVKKMGPTLGEQFHAVSDDLTVMFWRWREYRILFGDEPKRIELLNECAPFFFRLVQDVFFEETLLGIARLVGSAKSFGKDNLSIRRLPPLCKKEIRDEAQKLVFEAQSASTFAVDWRNRHIAHRDLALALRKPAQMLESATREKVDHSLSCLARVLNHIELAYCGATTAYGFSSGPWGAKTLLHILRDGLLREKDRQASWQRGELHDDKQPPEPI